MRNLTVQQRLAKARASLILGEPFFGTIALKLALVEDRSRPTIAVNGKQMRYNPEFIETLSDAELRTVLAHEVLHLCCNHHTRRRGRDAKTWNRAGDMAINPILEEAGFTMPAHALIDDAFKDKAAEQIYDLIYVEPPPGPGGGGSGEGGESGEGSDSGNNGSGKQPEQPQGGQQPGEQQHEDPGGMGEVEDAPSDVAEQPTEAEIAEAEREMRIAVAQAAQAAKSAGDLPVGLQRLVEALVAPKANWRELLRDFVSATLKNDYTWFPPNRRHVHRGMYLPSMKSDNVGPIVIGVDTSGSVSERELQQFAAEVQDIVNTVQPEACYVVYCDSAVEHYEVFEHGDEITTLNAKGGGGTAFTPVFRWVEQQGIEPLCLIYLTDLMSHRYPETAPEYPVLWVNTYMPRYQTLPWGDTIDLV